MADLDKSGTVNAVELKEILAQLGWTISVAGSMELISRLERTSQGGGVDVNEHVLSQKHFGRPPSKDKHRSIEQENCCTLLKPIIAIIRNRPGLRRMSRL